MNASHRKGIIWLVVAGNLAALFAFASSFAVNRIPWQTENYLAQWLPSPDKKLLCPESPELKKLVRRLFPIDKSDRQIDIKVRVMQGAEVNAFAALGGNIYIYEGLLKRAHSADEIAGVLAHEIAHVLNRHILQSLFTKLLTTATLHMIFTGSSGAGAVNWALDLRYSRAQEQQADDDGLERLKRASINPKAFSDFFKRLESDSSAPSFLSDHPASDERALNAMSMVVKNPTEVLSSTEWEQLKEICH